MRLYGGIEYELALMLSNFQRPAHEPNLPSWLRCYYDIGGPTYGNWLGWYEDWKERYEAGMSSR